MSLCVGTVHSLQGAERPVVIFSPVYSKHADGSFIDQSPSMLNVAVSRAKDAFLVFGDMDVLASAPPGSPRATLTQFICRHPANEMTFQLPTRSDLIQEQHAVTVLHDAADHDLFLLGENSRAKQRLCIVSPWINSMTMGQAGYLAAIADARTRGVKVDIYADPTLAAEKNSGGQSKFEEAQTTLAEIDVLLHPVSRLHSKLAWTDDAVLAVGSFNWCSAHRSGQYARHETSVVYRGGHLAEEIQVLESSLKTRVKPWLGKKPGRGKAASGPSSDRAEATAP